MRKILLLVSVLCLFSCQESRQYLSEMPSEPLQPERVYANLFLGRPYQIEVIDSVLIVAENVNDSILSFYDLRDSSLICRRFTVGQGPDDWLNPIKLDVDREKKQLFVLQRQRDRITAYGLDSLLLGRISPVQTVDLTSADVFARIPGGYVCGGHSEEGIVCLLDDGGRILQRLHFESDCVSGMSDQTLVYIVSQGNLVYTEGVLAFIPAFMGNIDFYRLDGSECVKISESRFADDSFADKVRSLKDNFSIGKDAILYCTESTADAGEFFVLNNGRKISEQGDAYRSFIYRFDKTGACIGKYETDNKIKDFCVQGKDMYCIAEPEGEEAVIMKYRLP